MPTGTAVEWLAGGTDLMDRRRHGISHGPVRSLPDDPRLNAITWRGDGSATIGAAVTIAAMATDARLAAAYPALAATAAGLATPEIRRMATLGGNIAQRNRCWYFRNPAFTCLKRGGATCPARTGNHLYAVAFDRGPCVAPHASSMAAALLAYDAIITTNTRPSATLGDILGDGRDGTRDHQLADGEWIIQVTLPLPVAGERATCRRAMSRASAEWPLVELVTRIATVGSRITAVALVAGGIAPVPIRLTPVEAALRDRDVASVPLAELQALGCQGATPLPMTSYKLDLLAGLIADAAAAWRGARLT